MSNVMRHVSVLIRHVGRELTPRCRFVCSCVVPLCHPPLVFCVLQVLHGDISQAQRDVTINQFRNKQFQVLVATDVAARGIDVSDIDLVVQYRPPHDSGKVKEQLQGLLASWISRSPVFRSPSKP